MLLVILFFGGTIYFIRGRKVEAAVKGFVFRDVPDMKYGARAKGILVHAGNDAALCFIKTDGVVASEGRIDSP